MYDDIYSLRPMDQRYNATGMNPDSIKTKLLSVFVLAFLCLNAGGAVCLVYCQGMSGGHQAEMGEHCPLAKTPDDCPLHSGMPAPAKDSTAIGSNAVSCCTIAINIFAAPLEKRQAAPEVAQTATVEPVSFASGHVPSVIKWTRPIAFAQPLYDQRIERLRHGVFRI